MKTPWLLWGAVLAFLLGLILVAGDVLLPFFFGGVLAYAFDPSVRWLGRQGMPRVLAALLITTAVVLALAAGIAIILPTLVNDVERLVGALPDLINRLQATLRPVLGPAAETLGLSEIDPQSIAGPATSAVQGVFGTVMALLNSALLILLTPVAMFFFLKDWGRVLRRLNSLLPDRSRPTVDRLVGGAHRQLGGFVRGVGLLCLSQALIHTVGLLLIGLDFAILIGLMTGLSAAVPVIGNLLMFTVALSTAIVQFDALLPILLVVALYGASQFLETSVLSPWLVGESVHLHPLWVIFALLIGGKLFGVMGAILALPAAAVLQVFATAAIDAYQNSDIKEEG